MGGGVLMSEVPLYDSSGEQVMFDPQQVIGNGRDTSPIRDCPPIRPYSRPVLRALWWS